ncbi:hypothetical protein GCM10010359_02020 [Streptomyces morookaense]|nr:hypothetical protein GCM10010359_02020 [Streptomyces morookaense]
MLDGLSDEQREARAELLRTLLNDVQAKLNVHGVSHVGHP